MDYGLTFEDVCKKYESYRAQCLRTTNKKEKGCVNPLDKKAEAFKKAYIQDCPLIPYEIAKKFIYYAMLRELGDDDFFYLKKFIEDQGLATIVNNKCFNLCFK